MAKSQYTPEFRAEAVRLTREPGATIKQVSRNLGISYESLRKWIARDEIDAGERKGLTTEDLTELRRLKREVRTLRMERDLLKKATAFFAREEDPTR